MTATRHAMVALSATAVVGIIWLASAYLSRKFSWKPWLVFAVLLVLFLGVASGIMAGTPGLFEKSAGFLFSSGQATNRLEMTQGALSLIGDFPFTGGGLESFPGLFSTYYLVTPNYIIPHSYNLYLDVALEQGIVALLALLWVLAVSTILLLVYGKSLLWPSSLLRWAVLASLLVFIVHSFLDDILYDSNETPFLFLLPGMAMALTAPGLALAAQSRRQRNTRRVYLGTALIVLAILSVGFLTRQSLISGWYANLGALQMARVELAVWNTSAWKDGSQVEQMKSAEELFTRALEFDPDNRTANHRLGLMDLMRRNFPAAITHLSRAVQKAPLHRGIIKSLGQSYLWNGEIDNALPLLEILPETPAEMDAYTWWWRVQGREDLAENAGLLRAQLDSAPTE
jgi:tetratricopeptide (TPR) repeat protein